MRQIQNDKVITHNSEANQRARIHYLLNELMFFQDEESLRKYGRLHPGMDGKLYGISNAELDELTTTFLMTMNEETLSASTGEFKGMYYELQTMTSNK